MSEARTDVLTGLPNRRALDEDLARQMSQWKRHARPVSVLMIDIDHFKKFNDTYGHQAGDAVLQQVAGLLRKTMREADLVGRFGGEEFSAILPSTDATEACRAAERARTAIHTATFTHEGEMLHVSVSIGAAQCLECEEADAFVKRADAALYTAKQAGRNRAYWHDRRECRCVSGAGTGKQAFAKSMPVQQPVTCDEEEMSVASFAAVCQDLRRRLEEVTSSDASQSGVDRGRVRASNHQPHCEHI